MKFKLKDCLKQTNENDVIANKYVFRCLTCEQIVVLIVMLLVATGIFVTNFGVTVRCVIITTIIYMLAIPVRLYADMSKRWVKYYLILLEILWVTCVGVFMTFHALLSYALPLLSATMFRSKKISIYTYVLLVFSMIVSVFAGYYYGICDTNMVLLSGEPMSYYINEYNQFTLNTINSDVVYSLSLFFVFPRCMILAAYLVVCKSVTKVLNKNIDYAHKMEDIAEKDGMTGLYNKTKYLQMIDDKYKSYNKIGVIFWDINFLKHTNDVLGHEMGDKLISTVAKSFMSIADGKSQTYRVGGDEFVMVIEGADQNIIHSKVSDWKKALGKLEDDFGYPISVSVGYAFGKGSNFDTITKEADNMMYVNKKIDHKTADTSYLTR